MPDIVQVSNANSFLKGAPRSFFNSGFDVGVLRPWTQNGKSYIAVNAGEGKRQAVQFKDNALLRKTEWEELDRVTVDVAATRLTGINDLRSRPGLVRRLGGLGTLIAQYNQLVDMDDAVVSMSPRDRSDSDTAGFNLKGVPVPIIHKGFDIDIRQLDASRRLGDGLDVTNGMVANRKVAEKIEDILFNGHTLTLDGYAIKGLTNFGEAATGSLTAAWSATGADPVADVLAMIGAANANNYYGPFGVWVPSSYGATLEDDYKAYSDQTVRQRIEAIDSVAFCKPAGKLSGKVVMQQLTPDCIQIAIAQDMVTVEWASRGGLIDDYLVLAAMVPIIKSDSAGNSGTVVYSE